MLSALHSETIEGVSWLEPFVQDFKVRFTTLLAGAYRSFSPALALSILDPKLTFSDAESQEAVTRDLSLHKADGSSLTPYDFKRLQVRLSMFPFLVHSGFVAQLCKALPSVHPKSKLLWNH